MPSVQVTEDTERHEQLLGFLVYLGSISQRKRREPIGTRVSVLSCKFRLGATFRVGRSLSLNVAHRRLFVARTFWDA